MSDTTDRILIVTQVFPPEKGGAASRIHDTSKHLVEDEWEVTVLAPPPCYPPDSFPRTWRRTYSDEINGITTHRLWGWQPGSEDPHFVSRLLYYLTFAIHSFFWVLFHGRKYDIMITSNPPIFTGIAGFPASIVWDKPWVVDVRDRWIANAITLGFLSESSLWTRLSRQLQGAVLDRADRITVTTHTLGESLCETYGDSLRIKLLVIPNGVDTSLFRPTDVEKESVIVYTGNIGYAQDLESCIRAMTYVDDPDVTLRLVGSGDVKSDLVELAATLGVDDQVEFTGLVPRSEVSLQINRAMIGIAPLQDRSELAYAVPTKAYEYLACKTPVIATGTGEIERFVRESGGGKHVENDPQKLAGAFEALLAADAEREKFGQQGYEYVTGTHDRMIIARKLSDELHDLICRSA